MKVRQKNYSEVFKRMLVEEFECGSLKNDQLQEKYNIGGNTHIFEWCKKYGKLHYASEESIGAPCNILIKKLKKELSDTKLKILAYIKLITVAEK